MAKVKRICRVCGKEYKTCATPSTYGLFSWRDVTCCVEHYNIYMQNIESSKGPLIEETLDTNTEDKGIEVAETPVVTLGCCIDDECEEPDEVAESEEDDEPATVYNEAEAF